MKTLHELKLMAAKKLPDLIFESEVDNHLVWSGEVIIKETEWLHICHLLEEMIGEATWLKYLSKLNLIDMFQ